MFRRLEAWEELDTVVALEALETLLEHGEMRVRHWRSLASSSEISLFISVVSCWKIRLESSYIDSMVKIKYLFSLAE